MRNEYSYCDIEKMVSDGRDESQFLEFKGNFSETGESGLLADKAKISIAEEIVAFLNTTGGDLFVGICESDENPHKAGHICKIADVADVARRLNDAVSSLIDPYPTGIGYSVLKQEDDDTSGVIHFHIPRSTNAPHAVRAKGGLRVLVRRGDAKQPIQMAELRSAVLEAYSERENAVRRIDEATQSFKRQIDLLGNAARKRVGFQVIFTPFVNQNLPPLWDKRATLGTISEFVWEYTDGYSENFTSVNAGRINIDRTILRGVRGGVERAEGVYSFSLNRFGTIESRFIQTEDRYFSEDQRAGKIFLGWILGEISTLYELSKKAQILAFPGAYEYAVSITVACTRTGDICGIGDLPIYIHWGNRGYDVFEVSPFSTPIYRFSSDQEFLEVCSDVRYDFLCHGGERLEYASVKSVKPRNN